MLRLHECDVVVVVVVATVVVIRCASDGCYCLTLSQQSRDALRITMSVAPVYSSRQLIALLSELTGHPASREV